jgi:Rps23 Pro-64 3,4-dihydroxylase Tpa1-like proline 4-hydroxylase
VGTLPAVNRSLEDAFDMQLEARLTDLKYAFYPTGGHYQRHVDGLNVGTKRREFSFVLYLNRGWRESDRGHLRVYDSREVRRQPLWV